MGIRAVLFDSSNNLLFNIMYSTPADYDYTKTQHYRDLMANQRLDNFCGEAERLAKDFQNETVKEIKDKKLMVMFDYIKCNLKDVYIVTERNRKMLTVFMARCNDAIAVERYAANPEFMNILNELKTILHELMDITPPGWIRIH
jgi:hypothetical protein